MDEQQSINKKIANQIPVIVQKSVQEQSKKPKRKGFLGIFGKKKEVTPAVSTTVRKEVKKKKKNQNVTEPGLDYYRFDSKWYTEICNDESFKVSGHFRLQPYGDGTRRLIWINEFTKNGYHRKATIDKVKDGEVSLT